VPVTGTGPRTSRTPEDSLPTELRRRLRSWVDVDEVGIDGLWVWLDTVLSVLPLPERGPVGSKTAAEPSERRLHQIARDLVDCARERARLTTVAARYFEDNGALSRRVKALEAKLVLAERSRAPAPDETDEEAETAVERYLPPGKGR
jgi:hypothetical protein